MIALKMDYETMVCAIFAIHDLLIMFSDKTNPAACILYLSVLN